MDKHKNNNIRNNKKKKEKKPASYYIKLYLCVFIAAFLVGSVFFKVYPTISGSADKKSETEVSYTDFMKKVKSGDVEKIIYHSGSSEITFIEKDDKTETEYTTSNPKYENFKKDMLEKNIEFEEVKEMNTSSVFSVISVMMTAVMLMAILKMVGVGGNGKMSTEVETENLPTFKDVAGLKEVKQDMQEIISFLKTPEKYTEAGCKLPKGVVLYGPPGTGKTLLAKAVAGEAGVPFYSVSGSDFIEKFVGVGAMRVRKLFDTAKKNAPCIVFIDEIDAVGTTRGGGSDHSENRQTINALLAEMDGFENSDGVVVIAATNRIKDLDPALVRPGRFDNKIAVPLPADSAERKEVISLYVKNKKFDDSFDMEGLVSETLGFSPAEIEALLNDAAIIAVRTNDGVINDACMDEALYKQVMNGHAKRDVERNKKDLEITAWHESGHAIVGWLLGLKPTKVTVVPSTSGAGGVTFFNQDKLGLFSKSELESQIMMAYAGRCAEKIHSGNEDDVTTGAENDLEKATQLILSMICEYGMSSNYGYLNLNAMKEKPENLYRVAAEISGQLYQKTEVLLNQYKPILDTMAKVLLEKETLTGDEITEVINCFPEDEYTDTDAEGNYSNDRIEYAETNTTDENIIE